MTWTYQLLAVRSLALLAISLPILGQDPAFISPEVRQQFIHRNEVSFFVILRDKADLSPAFGISDWEARGEFVHQRLVEVAESSQTELLKVLKVQGVSFRSFWVVNSIFITTDQETLVNFLATRPEVKAILSPIKGTIPKRDSTALAFPRVRTVEWNIDRIRAPLVWSTYGATGTGIVVANLDTGVEYDHPALVDQYRGNEGGGVFDHNYNWFDPSEACGSPSTAPCDPHFHGTATLGIMVGADSGGVNQIGVAPGAQWIAAALCYETEECFAPSALAAGQWFLAPTDLNGANPNSSLRPHVINNSWGSTGGDSWYLATVQAWVASGIFPQFAAGNDGPDCNSLISPGDYPESYTAGAFRINDTIWVGSSRGPSAFGPTKPNITAPGHNVRTSFPAGTYDVDTGTSFASPHVAGTVALLWSGQPSLVGDIEETQKMLNRSAIDTEDLTCGGIPGNNNIWGEGRLDALAAYESTTIFADGFESGDTSAWSITVP